MAEVPESILAEMQNVEVALGYLGRMKIRDEDPVPDMAATATFLHNIYNGIENILKQVLVMKGVEIPKFDAWHKELLTRAVTAGVISQELADELYDYMSFRHFFVHGYGFMLKQEPLVRLSAGLPAVWARFAEQIATCFGK